MAIKVANTTVINNSLELQNVASLDATTTSNIFDASTYTKYELPPYSTGSSNKNILFFANLSFDFGAGGWETTTAYSTWGDNTVDNIIYADSFGLTGGSNAWLAAENSAGVSKKVEIFSTTDLSSPSTILAGTVTVQTGPTNGFYKYTATIPANTSGFSAYIWFEPSVVLSNVVVRWEDSVNLITRSGSGRTNGFRNIQYWFQGDVGF
jgi:hypothetical protein